MTDPDTTRDDVPEDRSSIVPPRDAITGGFSRKADLLSYVLSGLLIGGVLDWAFGTAPIMLILWTLAAVAVGYWRLWQHSAELEEEAKGRGHGV